MAKDDRQSKKNCDLFLLSIHVTLLSGIKLNRGPRPGSPRLLKFGLGS